MPLDDPKQRSFSRTAMTAEMLDADTELELARAWRDDRDEAALHRLINAYTRLAISSAGKYRRYGVPMSDLVQEASVGLMKAAEKFDPDRGVRFSTYAVWWIKASIQEFVMRNWSLVRTGSTSSQKSLFFNLKRVQAQIEREATQVGENLTGEELDERISVELGVPLRDVKMMQGRMRGSDFSLNAVQSGDEDGREWLETLPDDGPQTEETVAQNEDRSKLRDWLMAALAKLSERERKIIRARKLEDEPRTLESLGGDLGVSKERVRQLEVQALVKLRKSLEIQAGPMAHALLLD